MERVPAGKLAKPPGRWAIAVVAIAAVLHLPGASLGQQRAGNDWVAKDVVPKRRDLQVRVNGAAGKRQAMIGTYKVEAVDGLSLLIDKPGILGWVSADDVVPVDRAIEFFSNAVRLNPQDTFSRTMRACVFLLAKKACELSEWKDANALEALAAACAETGDFDEAIKWQTRANAMASGLMNRFSGTLHLELYRMKEPYRDENLRLVGGAR